MNTESSRNHEILMVSFRRSVQDKEEKNTSSEGKDDKNAIVGGHVMPTIRKCKLLIVDLAGSEPLDKFGMLHMDSNTRLL
ncbi:armadillo repeat-containing kinesin-like protein 1 [Tanacetum coccineum]